DAQGSGWSAADLAVLIPYPLRLLRYHTQGSVHADWRQRAQGMRWAGSATILQGLVIAGGAAPLQALRLGDWSSGAQQIPSRLAAARDRAAELAGLPSVDARNLLGAVRAACGSTHDTVLVTITDGGMDFASNMLASLEAVDAYVPRLVVGMGRDLCVHFRQFVKTTCVEVYDDSNTTEQIAWGTHEYWQVVFRKHVLLTVIASSDLSDSIIYTDPDIVFLDSPIGHLSNTSFQANDDITFSPNNMLEINATSVEDLASRYETNGLVNITLGSKRRHPDINSGLFHMFASPIVAQFFLRAVKILKAQEFVHGHYQQFSLVKALADLPGIRVGVARADQFVNGNVFWGHRALLHPDRVVSVHANWMHPRRTKNGMSLNSRKSAQISWIGAGTSSLALGARQGRRWRRCQSAGEGRFITPPFRRLGGPPQGGWEV
ncbi:unnamed protein product, partial [Prorocentrum cordatum]